MLSRWNNRILVKQAWKLERTSLFGCKEVIASATKDSCYCVNLIILTPSIQVIIVVCSCCTFTLFSSSTQLE
ncbi:unnamed protein product [Auanema sp. JU1783]|nr:unnamed protein product [Auanema sp. JU1783]